MSIKDIMRKHGYTGGKKGLFEANEPSLEEVKKIIAKGKLEEAGFRIPVELHKYMDISPEGELVELQAIPEELQGLADEIRATWERIHSPEDLSEY
ncbi:MAG: hypothetical protein ACI4AQ_05750 [Lachnospiraceae bacterium]